MELTINNFRSLVDQKFIFDKGISLVKGPSGKGKTTVFEAIKWCLFGNSKNVYPISTKNPKPNFTQVKIKFIDYEICRKKPPEICTFKSKDIELDGEDAENYIKQLIGSKNLWEATSYVCQGERNLLMSLSSADKLSLIKEIIFSKEEEIIESYKEKNNSFLNNLEVEILQTQGKVEFSSNLLKTKNNPYDENQYTKAVKNKKNFKHKSALKKKLIDVEEKIIKNERSLGINETIKNMEQVVEETSNILCTYPVEITHEIIDKWKNFQKACTFLDSDDGYVYIENRDLDELIKIKHIVENNEKLPKNVNKKEIKAEINKIKEYLYNEKISNKYNIYLEKVEKIQNYISKLESIKPQIENLKKRIISLLHTENIEQGIKNIDNNKYNCPKCNVSLCIKNDEIIENKTILTKTEKIFVRENYKKILEFNEKIEIANNQLNNFKSVLDEIEKPKELEEPKTLDYEDLEKTLMLSEQYIEVNYTIKSVNETIRNLKKSKQKDYYFKMKSDNFVDFFENTPYPEDIDSYYSKYFLNVEKQKYAKKYLEKHKLQDIENNEKYLQLKSKINDTLESIVEDEKIITFYEDLKKEEKAHKILCEEYDELIKKKNSVLKIGKMINTITNETLDSLLVQLNKDLNEIMEEFFDDAYLEISMFKKVKKEYKPQFSFLLQINNIKYENINLLSGGEKDRVSIALTLALSKHFNFPFIMFDECMSSLDSDLREKCLGVIKKYASEKFILNICHETTEGYYDNVVYI